MLAQAWADVCVWKHGQVHDMQWPFDWVGQNLYAGRGIICCSCEHDSPVSLCYVPKISVCQRLTQITMTKLRRFNCGSMRGHHSTTRHLTAALKSAVITPRSPPILSHPSYLPTIVLFTCIKSSSTMMCSGCLGRQLPFGLWHCLLSESQSE
jgi:hypothetical protein